MAPTLQKPAGKTAPAPTAGQKAAETKADNKAKAAAQGSKPALAAKTPVGRPATGNTFQKGGPNDKNKAGKK